MVAREKKQRFSNHIDLTDEREGSEIRYRRIKQRINAVSTLNNNMKKAA